MVDGEEFTNKIPDIEEGWETQIGKTYQMCLIHRDFKHFAAPNAKHFRHLPQGLVNHVSQGLVNHAARCRAGDVSINQAF